VLRIQTAGESHGRGVFCLIDGFPAGVRVQPEDINFWLAERQKGYGRGGRQKIERDEVDVLAGIRAGVTLGGPILLAVWNRDFSNWTDAMDPWKKSKGERADKVIQPRPGHADLVGALKFNHDDCRNVLERASARETAGRVAAGALCRCLLREFDIDVVGHVVQIGHVVAHLDTIATKDIRTISMVSEVRCCDSKAGDKMIAAIKKAKQDKDSLGGIVEARAWGHPIALGSYTQWDRKIDAKIAEAMMSIQAVKGVQVGIGFEGVGRPGSQFHDEIVYTKQARAGNHYKRLTNRLGGTEGGMTNGEELVVRVAKKPISTLMRPLRTVNLKTKKPADAILERSDTCAVPALAIIVESVLASVLADAFLDRFGSDNLEQIKRNYKATARALERK
jgi:chorismate synthase